jgi:prepilin-type processing-associated H-X9-DG protein
MGNPNIGWIDGHATIAEMVEPFYPKDPAEWGNGVNDPANPQYTDEMWDIY